MDFIMSILIFVLASAALVAATAVAGITLGFLQALSIWICITFLIHLIKNM